MIQLAGSNTSDHSKKPVGVHIDRRDERCMTVVPRRRSGVESHCCEMVIIDEGILGLFSFVSFSVCCGMTPT